MKDRFLAFFREEEGLTTVEYAIGGALVGVAIVAAFRALGLQISTVITAITTAIS
jgi:pilus assembly protein Flp/PilA